MITFSYIPDLKSFVLVTANISNDQITNCTDGDIRLVNGTNQYSGRVEICANNIWGRVCGSGWSNYDAIVACNQLGFTGPGKAKYNMSAFHMYADIWLYFYYLCILYVHVAASAERSGIFGSGSGPVLMSGVQCYWNDPSLIECRSSNPAYCSDPEDAGVICEGTKLAVRLFNHTQN